MSENKKKYKGTYFISSISLTSAIVEYGISSIFILSLLYVLHFSTPLASQTYAYYYGLAYLLPILIGYLSDKYLSKSRALTIGFVVMILSQLFLSFSTSLYQPSNIEYNSYFFSIQNISYALGLFFLAVGAGFTNLSITHIITSINDKETSVHAFSLYYPILNLGVMLGAILMSVIIGEENYYMYKWTFLLFAIILIIGLIVFHLLKNKYLVDNKGKLMKDEHSKNSILEESNKLLGKVSSKSILEIKNLNLKERLVLFNSSLGKIEKDRLTVFLIFLLIIIFYRIAYSQTSVSMVFFIDIFVERNLYNYEVPVQLFFMLNPLFILILSPILMKFNNMINERKIEFGFIERTIVALLIIVLCFAMLSALGYYLDIDGTDKISIIWIPIVEFMVAISELLFSIAGYSLVGDLAPEKYYSLFFGLFLATRSISMYLSGKLSILFPTDGNPTFHMNIPINGLMNYFLIIVTMTLIAVIILYSLRKMLRRKMHLDKLIQ